MYDARSNLIIGFHGCDAMVANQLVNYPDFIKISKEDYDWLGHGFYFWENNYERALEWARAKESLGEIAKADVVGAVIQLGQCCDFLDTKFTNTISFYHSLMANEYRTYGKILPENINVRQDFYNDKLLRNLDCSTIEFMHRKISEKQKREIISQGYSDLKIFDSTRGVFIEGGPAFPGAGIMDKSHIQICIRNFDCIKGFFLPRHADNLS